MFDAMWPIGSVYISVTAKDAPFQNIPGCRSTWVQLGTGRTLWNVPTTDQLDVNVVGSLPNITGEFNPTYLDSDPAIGKGSHAHNVYTEALGEIPGGTFSGALKDPIIAEQYTTLDGANKGNMIVGFRFDASKSNAIYSASAGSNVVRPTSISTTMWKRIA